MVIRRDELEDKLNTKNRSTKPSEAVSTTGSDFTIPGRPKLQANIVLFADAKQGKSTFCCELLPEPVAYICFDRRADSAVYKATQAGRKIVYLDVDLPANISQVENVKARELGREAVKKVAKNFNWAVEQSNRGKIRSVVLDTGTEFHEILNVSITGKEQGEKNDFGKSRDLAAREWWRLFNRAREGKAHFIVLARAQEIWVGNEPTGRFKPQGPKVLLNACDYAAQLRLKGKGDKRFMEFEIHTAGINKEEEGSVYRDKDWGNRGPFVHACWMQFVDTSMPKDWE